VHVTVTPEAAKVELAGRLILALTIQNASSMVTRFRIDLASVPQGRGADHQAKQQKEGSDHQPR
jgi:hypothetical protein